MEEKQLLILGCSQVKRDAPGLLPAIDRYDGSQYRVLRSYLRKQDWPQSLSVAVLSAKYGLIGGFTGIENYDERMTPQKALELAPQCQTILRDWAAKHSKVYISLGKDYLPAVTPAIESDLNGRVKLFEGPIGMKLNQVKEFLNSTVAVPRRQAKLPEAGTESIKYFLPDWDDLLDEKFDFEKDTFSGATRSERTDKHCSILMKPKVISDGILVSLAQHVISKGPLRRIAGTEADSLAPRNLRSLYGLGPEQLLFGDCGAFSYVNEVAPTLSVEQALAMYELHGFDFGASVDHIPVPKVERNGQIVILSNNERVERINLTIKNAEAFINLARSRQVSFMPVGIVQALNAEGYAKTVNQYHELGYRYIAIGGLVPMPDSLVSEIVTEVMNVVAKLRPRPWIHLFGIFRPKLQELFKQLKVDSFDSATYFRKAWLRSDQNYLARNGKWYAALRVPMTKDARTRKELLQSGLDITILEAQEAKVLELLGKFDKDEAEVNDVLDAVIGYDKHLSRSSEVHSLRDKYKRTLEDRPWRECDCPFCKQYGIHVLIFRGANRNKRRGAHNTLMLYESL